MKLENVDLENTSSNTVCGAPYSIGGNGGNISVQDSNIIATLLVGIQTNVDHVGNVVISGNTTITANTYGILIYQGTLELNGSTEHYPIIKGLEQTGISLVYGIFNYQYGEIYGKLTINIKGATLTRQGTTLTTENQAGMYHTFLQ